MDLAAGREWQRIMKNHLTERLLSGHVFAGKGNDAGLTHIAASLEPERDDSAHLLTPAQIRRRDNCAFSRPAIGAGGVDHPLQAGSAVSPEPCWCCHGY